MASSAPVKLHTLLADYPITLPLKRGEVPLHGIEFDFAPVVQASSAFKRVVRDLEFDVAELAIITFLMAKAAGKPLALLPAVMVGRFQHPYLVYNSGRGELKPGDLNGRTVGIRSYSVTTGAWLRGILAHDHGVDIDKVTWVTFEEPHVAEYRDPSNVRRAPEGKNIVQMLLDGEIDAAVTGDGPPADPRIKQLIRDPAAAAADWQKRNGALQINHMAVVRESFTRDNPDVVREVYRALAQSKQQAVAAGAADLPFGIEANRRNLEVAIEYAFEQRLIPRRYEVDELFNDVTRNLA
jgi:4,5-dihydroxyphthalate decarboxylase